MKKIVAVAILFFVACSTPAVAGPKRAEGGQKCTIVGTSKNDYLVGTSKNDVICGLGGNDTIVGKKGNDVLDGGSGKDAIKGGSGNDILFGGSKNDTIKGDSGNDVLVGGTGNDVQSGGSGDDICTYDPNDRSSSDCSSARAKIGSLGLDVRVTFSGNKQVFKGKNTSNKDYYLTQGTTIYTYDGEPRCGGGSDIGLVRAGDDFVVERDSDDGCIDKGVPVFAVLRINAQSSFQAAYEYRPPEDTEFQYHVVERNLPFKIESGLSASITNVTQNCIGFRATSATKSGRLTLFANVYDSQGILVGGGGIVNPYTDGREVEITAGQSLTGCIGDYLSYNGSVKLQGKTIKLIVGHVEVEPSHPWS